MGCSWGDVRLARARGVGATGAGTCHGLHGERRCSWNRGRATCHVSLGRTRAGARRLFLQKEKTRPIISEAPREGGLRGGELRPGGAALNPAPRAVRGPAGRRHVWGAGAEEGRHTSSVCAEMTGPSAREAAGAAPAVPLPTSGQRPAGAPRAAASSLGRGDESGRVKQARPAVEARCPPLVQVMAGLGAPDTSHRRTAVAPSVTVVFAGSRVNAGATSRQRRGRDSGRCASGAGTAVRPFRELLAEITQQYNRTPSGGDQTFRPAVCGLEGCGPPRDACAGHSARRGRTVLGECQREGEAFVWKTVV